MFFDLVSKKVHNDEVNLFALMNCCRHVPMRKLIFFMIKRKKIPLALIFKEKTWSLFLFEND